MLNKAFFVYTVAMLFSFVISSLIPTKGLYLVMGIVATLYLLPTFIKLRQTEEIRKGTPMPEGPLKTNQVNEGFQARELNDTSMSNPFENITMDEYTYNNLRGPAKGKTDLDAFFRVQWSSDPTDVFGKSQSQRMFYTTPNTTIPNDQKSYQEWLYKIPDLTCKEGNEEACVRGSEGAPIPWLNL